MNPNTANLADNITRLGLAVGQSGRIEALAKLNTTIGRAP